MPLSPSTGSLKYPSTLGQPPLGHCRAQGANRCEQQGGVSKPRAGGQRHCARQLDTNAGPEPHRRILISDGGDDRGGTRIKDGASIAAQRRTG